MDHAPDEFERIEPGPGGAGHEPQPFIETTPFAEPVPPGEFHQE
jgi:hypothetical protein